MVTFSFLRVLTPVALLDYMRTSTGTHLARYVRVTIRYPGHWAEIRPRHFATVTSIFALLALSPNGAYEQCGGLGWTGSVTCVEG